MFDEKQRDQEITARIGTTRIFAKEFHILYVNLLIFVTLEAILYVQVRIALLWLTNKKVMITVVIPIQAYAQMHSLLGRNEHFVTK